MSYDITGKVVYILPEQSGTGKNGQWVKQDFVIETQEQYSKKVCFSAWGDKASLVKSLSIGNLINISFNVESREYNGKWYSDLKVWKINKGQEAAQQIPESFDVLEPINPDDASNDLPF